MEKVNKMSLKQSRILYFLLTIIGVFFIFNSEDFSWSGVFLALGVVFSPFSEQQFSKLNLVQKSLIFGQMLLAILLIGLNMYLTIGR